VHKHALNSDSFGFDFDCCIIIFSTLVSENKTFQSSSRLPPLSVLFLSEPAVSLSREDFVLNSYVLYNNGTQDHKCNEWQDPS
jgi:hypothetical protein